MTQLSATCYAELAIGFTGAHSRPVRGLRERGGQQIEPDEEGCVEDVEAVSLSVEIRRHEMVSHLHSREYGQLVDLLAGCDLKSPDMVRFLSNLTDALRDDAVDALLNEVD